MNSHTMKSVNIMNFARQCEPRDAETDALLFQTTKQQLEMLNELQLPNTFLLQYDALCDARFVQLFREQAGPNTETGLWYEIVEPLTTACGMPYESENGWKWDWHINRRISRRCRLVADRHADCLPPGRQLRRQMSLHLPRPDEHRRLFAGGRLFQRRLLSVAQQYLYAGADGRANAARACVPAARSQSDP